MNTTDKKLFKIAQKHFGVTTLETRNQDCLDHQDCAVWNIKAALRAAYDAGRRDANAAN